MTEKLNNLLRCVLCKTLFRGGEEKLCSGCQEWQETMKDVSGTPVAKKYKKRERY
jgi:predicted amidophosphoribosyltransferase